MGARFDKACGKMDFLAFIHSPINTGLAFAQRFFPPVGANPLDMQGMNWPIINGQMRTCAWLSVEAMAAPGVALSNFCWVLCAALVLIAACSNSWLADFTLAFRSSNKRELAQFGVTNAQRAVLTDEVLDELKHTTTTGRRF